MKERKQWMTHWLAMHRDAYAINIVVGPVWAYDEKQARFEAGNCLTGFKLTFVKAEPYKRTRRKAQ